MYWVLGRVRTFLPLLTLLLEESDCLVCPDKFILTQKQRLNKHRYQKFLTTLNYEINIIRRLIGVSIGVERLLEALKVL